MIFWNALMRTSVWYFVYHTFSVQYFYVRVQYEIYTLIFPFDLMCKIGIIHMYVATKWYLNNDIFFITDGTDYEILYNTISIPSNVNTSKFKIRILDDCDHEDTEKFEVEIMKFPGRDNNSHLLEPAYNRRATITIIDDDPYDGHCE